MKPFTDLLLSDLQRRVRKVSMDNLLAYLVRCGTVCHAILDDGKTFVIRFIDHAGKVVRGYGRTVRDALIAVSHSYWCGVRGQETV